MCGKLGWNTPLRREHIAHKTERLVTEMCDAHILKYVKQVNTLLLHSNYNLFINVISNVSGS